MIKVVLHENMSLVDADIEEVIQSVAHEVGFDSVRVVRFQNGIDLADKLTPEKSVLVDLAFVPYEMPGLSGLEALREVRSFLPTLRSVMIADGAEHAGEAAAVGVDGYLISPLSAGAFKQCALAQMAAVAKLQAESFVVNGRTGVRRLRFGEVRYCQTSGHDQEIHLIDGETVTVRFSSQALFELLAGDPRFFKLGSSNIINLDEVVETRTSEGVVELVGGIALAVPVRLRKPLEDALLKVL